jgi:iron(III) transport system substrate-binding protein
MRYLRLLVLALTVLWAGGCQAAPPASTQPSAAGKPGTKPIEADGTEPSAELQRLVEAAKQGGETELVLAWSTSALSTAGTERLIALFHEAYRPYGLDVRVSFTPGLELSAQTTTIIQEAAAGQRASTDIVVGSETHFAELRPRNAVQQHDYAALLPEARRMVVAYDNVGVEVYSDVTAIVYNTNLVAPADVPRSLEAVLNPKWKGQIASSSSTCRFDRVSMRPEWGAEKMRTYLDAFVGQLGGLVNCGDVIRVSTGEFPMLALTTAYRGLQEQARGAPLGIVVPEDAATASPIHVGIPLTAANPNLAKLFIALVASEAGQSALWENFRADHHELPGSQTALLLKDLEARGVKVLKTDVKFVVENPELAARTTEFRPLLPDRFARRG